MKKITLLLFAIFSLTFGWQSMAQSVSTQNFATSGSDSTPTVLTINSSDITVNQGQPIQQVVLGTFNGLYFGSDECGNYFDFDLSVTAGTADGTVIANGCDADFNGLDVTGFTTITITSNDIDNWTDTVDFDIDLEVTYQTPSCITPLSMSSTSVTSSTVDLTWSAGASGESAWNLEWKAGADFTPGNAEEDASDSASGTAAYNATGLSPNTTYYFYYQADCGGGDTSDWVGPFVVTTLCAAIVPDYTADMSNNPVDVCWTEANNGDVTSGPTDLGSGLWYASNHNGTPSNAINLWSDVRSDWIISPTFDLSTSAPSELNVYVALTEGSTSGSDADLGSDDSVDLLMTTDGGTTWTSLQTWTQGNVPTDIGEQITYDLSAVTGTVQFAFLGDEGDVDDTEDVYFHVSQFRVRETPSCVEPSNLDILNLTSTSVDLLWSAGGSESIWNVEIVDLTAGGTVTGTATDTGVSNPFSVSGLTPNNDYEFYVQADCGGGDTSAWVGPFSFSTLCNPITSYPWSEDFESVSTPDLPSCWSHINNNGDTDNWQTYTTYGVAGSIAAGLYTDFNSGNNDDYLVLPQFTLTGNERLKFSVRARSSSEPNDYRVVLSTSGSTPTDFTEELLPLTQVSSTTQTEIAPIDLSSYTGDVYIAIHVPSGGLDGYYIYFDEFVVEPIPSCVEPSDLTATNIMATSADLGWTENGTASTYNVEVLLAGDAATGTATDTGVANGFTKSGLADNTDYEYYVQAICGGDTSAWSGPYAFTTLCAAIVPNYIADFSTIAPSCWTEGNDTDVATGPDGNNGGWINDDFLNTAGIEAAKFNLYSDFQQDWLVSPVFDFSSGGYGLAFDVGVTAWNSTDAETPNLMGSDDEVLLLISVDNGVTWTTLEAFNVENAPSHTGDNKIYDLSTITSSTVKFAFWATDGSVDDAEDIDFFVANFNVDLNTSLGVTKFEDEATFTYYPNPVNDNLTLKAQKEISNVSVYNMLGQEVYRNAPNSVDNLVNMSDLQSGAYFVKVTIDNVTETIKVIKK
ncbi:hypothetical protein BFP78_09940 [Gaetbulibacter sp. 5U11]|nr:hypothetical protein BFP78_09940 [Gaetbulibacter sp. 5U11]